MIHGMSQPKPFPLRLPPKLRTFLGESAKENGQSLNAEIVERLSISADVYDDLFTQRVRAIVQQELSKNPPK